MEDYKFWITLFFGLCGFIAFILTLNNSHRVKRIEDELTNELDVDVGWSKPDAQGNTTCSVKAMLYPVTEVRVKLSSEEWFIEHLDPNITQQRQFHAVNSGVRYNIQFRDPATSKKYTHKRIIRFS
jgi:hypothetical protein